MPRIPLALAALLLAALLLAPAAAPAGASTVVIGELYAGGGNSGATYANDYVELFNRSSSAVSVTGWTVQYASAASSSWDATPLTGSIPAGGHYLVKLASAAAVGAALPAADATGTTNLAASGGKVALVTVATDLVCTTACSAAANVADFVGYGSANDSEGATAGAMTNTTALTRAAGGCTDADDNSADFASATPAPLNSSSPLRACGAATGSNGLLAVGLDLAPVIALALDHTSILFSGAVAGSTPTPQSVAATVTTNNPLGYALLVSRTAFTPSDLPLGIDVASGTLTAIPITPATALQIASASTATAAAGTVVATRIGFLSALPALASTHYSSTVTYTAIAR
jgi:hypothetical protein